MGSVGKVTMQLLTELGHRGIRFFHGLGSVGLLFRETVGWVFFGRVRGVKPRRKETFYQMVRVGLKALPVVSLVLGFVGITLALTLAHVMKDFGTLDYVPWALGIAMVREFGPLVTAIVLSGFAGAAIAAELGTMKVSEEILALETSAVDPVRFLVVPRLVAILVMLPAVAMIGDVMGIAGGLFIGVQFIGQDAGYFMRIVFDTLELKDCIVGVCKAVAFAFVIGLIACHQGMNVTGGAEGVGTATKATVVQCIVAIIAVDCFFTIFFYILM